MTIFLYYRPSWHWRAPDRAAPPVGRANVFPIRELIDFPDIPIMAVNNPLKATDRA